MTITEIAGFAGAGLAGAAYVPQISHLIRARCSAGINPPLTTQRSRALSAPGWPEQPTYRRFPTSSGPAARLASAGWHLGYGCWQRFWSQHAPSPSTPACSSCSAGSRSWPRHSSWSMRPGTRTRPAPSICLASPRPTQPRGRHLRKRAWSWRPSGRPIAESAAPAGRGGALRASVPVLHRRSYPAIARPGREADAQAVRSWPGPRIAAAAPGANVARPGSSRPCTGFQTTHLKGTT